MPTSKDTTTTLNQGVGGDLMDESLATQSDGSTKAKRPRVVIGGDIGYDGTTNDIVQPTTNLKGTSVYLPVVDPSTLMLARSLNAILEELEAIRAVMEDAFGLDLKQSLLKKGDRQFLMTKEKK